MLFRSVYLPLHQLLVVSRQLGHLNAPVCNRLQQEPAPISSRNRPSLLFRFRFFLFLLLTPEAAHPTPNSSQPTPSPARSFSHQQQASHSFQQYVHKDNSCFLVRPPNRPGSCAVRHLQDTGDNVSTQRCQNTDNQTRREVRFVRSKIAHNFSRCGVSLAFSVTFGLGKSNNTMTLPALATE